MPRVGFIDYLLNWRRARADDRLIEDAPPTPVVLLGAVQDADTLQRVAVNASGEVSEANSSTINDYTNYMQRSLLWQEVYFGTPNVQSGADAAAARKRFLTVSYTATGGGEIVAADLVPALAGYMSKCTIWGFWSDQTDAGAALTFTGGVITPVAAWTITTTAGAVTDHSPGVVFNGDTANTAIQLASAAGQLGAAQLLVPLGVYWYEAV